MSGVVDEHINFIGVCQVRVNVLDESLELKEVNEELTTLPEMEIALGGALVAGDQRRWLIMEHRMSSEQKRFHCSTSVTFTAGDDTSSMGIATTREHAFAG